MQLSLVPLSRKESTTQKEVRAKNVRLCFGDFLAVAKKWPAPTAVVIDGPYGLKSFPGDPVSHISLVDWYRPHMTYISNRALPSTTLWFWNSEVGWATVHPLLEQLGWEYRCCNVWNKGLGHAAGNSNTKTLRKFPVVSEVCVQYVRKIQLTSSGNLLSMKDWLRAEWERTNLPLRAANEACAVANAATRKYLTKDHLWYFPPAVEFVKLARYANQYGDPKGKPYFADKDGSQFTAERWESLRAKFNCPVGVTNVWNHPAVRSSERLKIGLKCKHMNQKPLTLLDLIITASTDLADVVWEPFGGLCSTAISALRTGRSCFSSEINKEYFQIAKERILTYARS